MPGAFHVPGGGELIRTLASLEKAIERLASQKREIDVKIALGDQLQAAATPGARVRVLNQIANQGAAGDRTPALRRQLAIYRQGRDQVRTLRRSRERLGLQLADLQRRYRAMPYGAPGSRQEAAAQRVRDRIGLIARTRHEMRQRMRRARSRAVGAREAAGALGEAGTSGSVGAAGLALGMARLTTAIGVATGVFRASQQVVGAAYANLHHYGHFSAGGARALATEMMGDTMRSIRISHATARGMQQFAESSQRFKNSLEPITTAMANITNHLGARLLHTGAAGMEAGNAAAGKLWGWAAPWLNKAGIPDAAKGLWDWWGKKVGDNGQVAEDPFAAIRKGLFGMAGMGMPGGGGGVARRRRAGMDARMAGAALDAARRAARLDPNRPNSARRLRKRQDQEARRRKVEIERNRRFWGRAIGRDAMVADLEEKRGMAREWSRRAGELRNRRRRGPLSRDEEDELRGTERRIKEFNDKIKRLEESLRQQFGMHANNNNMMPHILFAGNDQGWAETPLSPRLQPGFGPNAPARLGWA